MTGDQALLCMELAILRVRDEARSYPHANMSLDKALNQIAIHLAEFSNQERLGRKAAQETGGEVCPRCRINRVGSLPVYLGSDGEGHICGVCWQEDRHAAAITSGQRGT